MNDPMEIDGKRQSGGTGSLENSILFLCQKKPGGVSQETLTNELVATSNVLLAEIGAAINSLLSQGMLKIFQDANKEITFQAIDSEQASKFRGLNAEERLLYQLVEQAGTEGIWIKYLKSRSGIPLPRIPRIIQTLERRKLIKLYKTAEKRLYMLYDLEPPRKAWFEGNEYNMEKINLLASKCEDYIASKGYASVEDLTTFLRSFGMGSEEKVEMTAEDVQLILNVLVYDGKIEQFTHPREQLSKLMMPSNGLTEAPCGVCPVFDKCSDEGEINPRTCPYLRGWLEF